MRSPEDSHLKVLTPYDLREGISLKKAADRAGKSETTLRNWCMQYGLGRRVGGGVWVVSNVALAMFLDDDRIALTAYLSGDRSSSLVKQYFERVGVPLPEVAADLTTSARGTKRPASDVPPSAANGAKSDITQTAQSEPRLTRGWDTNAAQMTAPNSAGEQRECLVEATKF